LTFDEGDLCLKRDYSDRQLGLTPRASLIPPPGEGLRIYISNKPPEEAASAGLLTTGELWVSTKLGPKTLFHFFFFF
jgi:hypothetical protein